MMKRFGLLLGVLALLLSASACAQTPSPPPPGSASLPSAAPTFAGPTSPAQARIYFYRLVGSYQFPRYTSVWLGETKVGDLGPGGYFYRDVQPGTYKVGVYSDVPYPNQYETVTFAPNSTTYIEVFNVPGYGISYTIGQTPSAYMPSVFGNRVVDPAVARREMLGLTPN